MRAVQKALDKNFGYSLALLPSNPMPAAPGSGGSAGSATASSDYIVFNALRSPQLQHELAENSPNAAWMGFVFVVLHCINSMPGASTV